MSRLSDSDKSQIIQLYRQSGETTLTLAERYGVSNTTISRILKSSLSPEEYDSLIQQKRSASRSSSKSSEPVAPPVQGNLLETVEPVKAPEPVATPEPVEPVEVSKKPVLRRSRRTEPEAVEATPVAAEPELTQASTVEAIVGEDLTPSTGGMMDDDEDDLEDDLDDLDNLDEDLDDDDDDEPALLPSIQLNASQFIRVLPIAEAAIPKTCYLVVDRSAELVARPLSEFAELGQIPKDEIEEKTLPVFDNHRVAKRFSNIRTQRVIKVPDSRVLQKAAPHLQAKGITRLLIDGQVYAL
jgi:transposase-like protein